ncbi:Na+/H+ antiporter subunit E [Cryobacterium sp. LW097]|nr:Na+/H+ antiporter subunit E [Cryobacterium sp. LW097]TFC53948.1 Na+/H+ antiporter subunit E [Cryobacterium sp. TMB3-1-2]TFC73764.1 Na+/H+ antiporter subunit E [Cryobacterium sp. TMB3-15]TFC77703.1 Na+/H+ antiporter subunit E [Cryobacterium sp. TMB3-10]TFC91598.1 Na+/H+ antiporter subunit E [Cryobacterium sp. TMT4-31]TFD43009.1 Na+/H+ antiporter subunit E [Cryobacterium sp. TMB3-12]
MPHRLRRPRLRPRRPRRREHRRAVDLHRRRLPRRCPVSARRERLAAALNQLPLFLGLVLLWALLWGKFSWLNLLTGVIFAAVVSIVFYLPAVQLSGRINLWRSAWLFGKLLFDIVRASVDVSWLALGPTYTPSNAIVAVHLRTRSDLILTWTAVATSIVPGSIVVDIERLDSTLYLHVINMHDVAATQKFRARVLATERRIVLAFGSAEDVERVSRVRAEEDLRHGLDRSAGPHTPTDPQNGAPA